MSQILDLPALIKERRDQSAVLAAQGAQAQSQSVRLSNEADLFQALLNEKITLFAEEKSIVPNNPPLPA